MAAYKTVTQATDWFYVIPQKEGVNQEQIVWRIGVWAQNDEGEIIGLISVTKGGYDDINKNEFNHLVAIPPLRGCYKHRDELTPEQLTLSKKPG